MIGYEVMNESTHRIWIRNWASFMSLSNMSENILHLLLFSLVTKSNDSILVGSFL